MMWNVEEEEEEQLDKTNSKITHSKSNSLEEETEEQERKNFDSYFDYEPEISKDDKDKLELNDTEINDSYYYNFQRPRRDNTGGYDVNATNDDYSENEPFHTVRFYELPRPYSPGKPYNSRFEGSTGSFESSPSTPEPIFGKISLKEGGRVGLRNIGNTCYLNSTLQCLCASRELSYSLAKDFEGGKYRETAFTSALGRVFHEMWQSEGKLSSLSRSVEPRQFKNLLGQVDSRFIGYHQEDSQEALSIILDRLHEELKRGQDGGDDDEIGYGDARIPSLSTASDNWAEYCRKENSLIRSLFHGQLKSSLKCCRCSFVSETFDPFCFLNLPVSSPATEKVSPTALYGIENEAIVAITAEKLTTVTKVSSKSFDIFCYNDRPVFNHQSAHLLTKKTFRGAQEFRQFFRGSAFWIAKLQGNSLISLGTRLPLECIGDDNVSYIAYRADLTFKNYLVTLILDETDQVYGFPILIKLSRLDVLTLRGFIENFLRDQIGPVLRLRFPKRSDFLESAIQLMLASCNEYFAIDEASRRIQHDLEILNIRLLNDKSGLNELIFFKELDDPDDLFEELIIDLTDDDDDDDDDKAQSSTEMQGYRQPCVYGSSMYESPSSYIPAYSASSSSSSVDLLSPCTLSDCFDKFLSVENLSDTDNWKCERCGIPVAAEKKLELWRLPELLIVHLKRFSYDNMSQKYAYSSLRGSKIGRPVDFPLEMDLSDRLAAGSPVGNDKDALFRLYAVSQHFGSLNFGHYTAIIWHEGTGKWHLADDSSFTQFDTIDQWYTNTERAKEAAYILFYRRCKE